MDSIIEYDLAQGNELTDMDSLTKIIEINMNSFIVDIEAALQSCKILFGNRGQRATLAKMNC